MTCGFVSGWFRLEISIVRNGKREGEGRNICMEAQRYIKDGVLHISLVRVFLNGLQKLNDTSDITF